MCLIQVPDLQNEGKTGIPPLYRDDIENLWREIGKKPQIGEGNYPKSNTFCAMYMLLKNGARTDLLNRHHEGIEDVLERHPTPIVRDTLKEAMRLLGR